MEKVICSEKTCLNFIEIIKMKAICIISMEKKSMKDYSKMVNIMEKVIILQENNDKIIVLKLFEGIKFDTNGK